MSKVVLKGFIQVPSDELEAINQELANHCRLTLEEPGCITFRVIQEENDPCRFNVYEEFVDREAFELHQRRVAGSDWGKLTRNAERHYDIIE
ncbi:putative quinol monooxygenase [Kushneria indalinina]|uniref:Quinol monooxygenase YgiN n=1 Tax=Kushneria indalinina DSM 14324 TaxID=1122140 RepID=A0A3D9E064_9GAMM|nr:antibiotic biosynthesis monooxygenase [Kushneria indalinina]REC96430.1 quinol monooxygenase YgiN [Kushneria indalinina DSM 14324]